MKLLVISDAHLITKNGKKAAYAPYVKEMDLWMSKVGQTTVISPDKIDHPLLSKDFKIQEFRHVGTTRLEFHKIKQALLSIVKIPVQTIMLWREMRKADHIHLRAPGNLTLLACMVQIFFPLKAKTAKYAGNWDPQASQPLSYRWQKRILSSTKLTKNMKVMAYGEWPEQSKNIEPFFTATYSEKDTAVIQKEFNEPLQFIFVGTLSQNKNPQFLIELVQKLNANGISSQAHFYGDGPMMEKFEIIAKNQIQIQNNIPDLKVQNLDVERPDNQNHKTITSSKSREMNANSKHQSNPVLKDSREIESDLKTISSLGKSPQDNGAFTFHGNQPAEVVKEAYKKAHFIFLASQSEGWPKVIAEGMWHGCIPIATAVSCVPWMLQQESTAGHGLDAAMHRGILFHTIDQTMVEVKNLVEDPQKFFVISRRAQEWSQQYTTERFETAIEKLLKDTHQDN